MEKSDLKKEYKILYSAQTDKVSVVDVPVFNYLMIDGMGDPNKSEDFKTAVEMLYTSAYTIKGISKKILEKDFVVPPLEGLWWVKNIEKFSYDEKNNWFWTLMILQPGYINKEIFNDAIILAQGKKPGLPFNRIRFEKYSEGKSVQILHSGSYSSEKPTIEKLHAFAAENGYKLHKKHHEIYVSDARKTPAGKLKTILRNPIK